MPDKQKSHTEPISFEHIGGEKVGHPVPEKTEKEIDFSAIGGKCVRRASDHPMRKHTKLIESEDAMLGEEPADF